MRKFLITMAAIFALTASDRSAMAAAYNWTGLYIGGNAGGSWGQTQEHYTIPNVGVTVNSTVHPSSVIGGGQLGYNQQVGPWVFSIETDIAGRQSTPDKVLNFGPPFGDHTNIHAEQNWLGTLRPRAGFAVGDNYLLYITGGLAYGGLKHKFSENRPGVASRSVSESETSAGWTAGGGAGYAFNDQWSAGIEYLYVDLGTSTISMPTQTINSVLFSHSSTKFNDRSHVFRAKLNFKFW
jgi:outer membrane immunogenic protein